MVKTTPLPGTHMWYGMHIRIVMHLLENATLLKITAPGAGRRPYVDSDGVLEI